MTPPIEPEARPEPELAEPVLARQNRLRLSLVWLVPLVALVVGLGLVARSFLKQGPEVRIEFAGAEGLQAGRTEVKFKDVVVGRVIRVELRPDRQKVVATVQLDKNAAGLAVVDTRFWVVRPRIGTAGISGLGTLLSGPYIGVDAGESREQVRDFVGLDIPPAVLRGEPGRRFVLHAADLGSLDFGSPVYCRHIRVGRVVGYALDKDGRGLAIQVFIEAPNEHLVTTDTRFWAASGVEVALSAAGLTVKTQSLASLLAGGIAFDTPDGAHTAPAATAGQAFRLFDSQRAALASEEGEALHVRMVFAQSVRGLDSGAPIDLQGIEVGAVRSISIQGSLRDGQLPMEVEADLYPQRFGRLHARFAGERGAGADHDRVMLAYLVREGLRAQLRDGNLLTGRMYVALDFQPKAARIAFDARAAVPTLPTVRNAFADVQDQLAQTVKRLSQVRFDEIGAGVQDTLKLVDAAMGALQRSLAGFDGTLQRLTPDAQRLIVELRQTLPTLQRSLDAAQRSLGLANSNLLEADAPLQRQALQSLVELQRAAQALRALADTLQRDPQALLRGRGPDPDPTRPSR